MADFTEFIYEVELVLTLETDVTVAVPTVGTVDAGETEGFVTTGQTVGVVVSGESYGLVG